MDYAPPAAIEYALIATTVLVVMYVPVWWVAGLATAVTVYLTFGQLADWPIAVSLLHALPAMVFAGSRNAKALEREERIRRRLEEADRITTQSRDAVELRRLD